MIFFEGLSKPWKRTRVFTAPADCQPPVIGCPANIIFSADPGQCAAVVHYYAPQGIDNLPGSTTVTDEEVLVKKLVIME